MNWLEAPVLAGSDGLGVLRLRTSEADGFGSDILQRSAVLVAGILLSRQAQSEAQHRRRSILLEELLAERGGSRAPSCSGVRSAPASRWTPSWWCW